MNRNCPDSCFHCVQLLDGVSVGNVSHHSRQLLQRNFSTLEIVLANNPRDVLVLLDVADVHQCSKVGFPYLCFCVPSF